jgi:aryl-alcohol dehydrogenase-like predicted oxidoreductase
LKYVNFGSTGLRVSRVCLGMMSFGTGSDRPWVLDEQAAEPIVKAAADAGITFYDTADAYSGGASEVATGRLLGKMFTRDDVVVATKVFFPVVAGDRGQGRPEPVQGRGENSGGLSRKHIMSAIDASLRRLDMDYVDLYQIHRWDYRTPIEETMEALHDVVRAGKARYIGASSMFAWQFAKAQHVAERHGWSRFASMQNHYNLLYREEEREMIPQCVDQGVAVIPWSPLARGVLAGTRTRDGERRTTRSRTDSFGDTLYDSPGDFDVVDRVQEVAGRRGVPAAQIALAWLLHRTGVTAPIVGATRLGHLEDALAAEQLELSDEEMRSLEEPYVAHGIRGHQ